MCSFYIFAMKIVGIQPKPNMMVYKMVKSIKWFIKCKKTFKNRRRRIKTDKNVRKGKKGIKMDENV